jgi:class 3 adenylate cyclase
MREWLPCATVCDWLARMSEQRHLAAIVSADVAGYSRLMGRDDRAARSEACAGIAGNVSSPAFASPMPRGYLSSQMSSKR